MANYTPNYQLHQWAPEDKFLRTDFNEDLNKIDTALGDSATKTAALEAAVNKRGNCNMELFTYTGTGTYGEGKAKKIQFSVKPDLYFVAGHNTLILGPGASKSPLLIAEDPISGTFVKGTDVTWSGNTLSLVNTVSAQYQMNVKDKVYWVLGLKRK